MEGTKTNDRDEMQWFVMRDHQRKSRNAAGEKLTAWQTVAERGIEVFVPMKWAVSVAGGKRRKVKVPAIRDLVFVHGTRNQIDPISQSDLGLTYRFVKGAPYGTPMTVRHSEMEVFIAAVNGCPDPRYFTSDELTEDAIGRMVEVVGGPMDGCRGRLLKVRGSKKRRLIISLESLIFAAIEVDPSHIHLLPE